LNLERAAPKKQEDPFMPFDPNQWLEAVDAYHRGERGPSEGPAPTGETEAAARHCFGCGETYLAFAKNWERFPDPANPYALCPNCVGAHERSATAVSFHPLEYRHLFRHIKEERRLLAEARVRDN